MLWKNLCECPDIGGNPELHHISVHCSPPSGVNVLSSCAPTTTPSPHAAGQPAKTPPPLYGVGRGASSRANTCLGSATATTPSLDPAASCMLDQYLVCVTACSWGRMVLEMHRGLEHFNFSCLPPKDISDMPNPWHARAQSSLHPAA